MEQRASPNGSAIEYYPLEGGPCGSENLYMIIGNKSGELDGQQVVGGVTYARAQCSDPAQWTLVEPNDVEAPEDRFIVKAVGLGYGEGFPDEYVLDCREQGPAALECEQSNPVDNEDLGELWYFRKLDK